MRRLAGAFVFGAVALATAASGADAAALKLAPWKDDLFQYPAVI